MNLRLADTIGSIASVITVSAFLPQAIKIWRQREAGAISLKTYLLLVSSSGLWTWFGVVIHSTPVIITNSVCLCTQISIIALKVWAR